jgi:phage gp29-like protein
MAKKGIWINKDQFVQFSDNMTSLSGEIATRERSIDFYSLGMYLPNPDPVLKKTGKDISVYKDLLVDGHLGGCFSSRKSGVKSLNWEIDRGKAKSRQAKVITSLFANDLDMENIISEMLNAWYYGYQVLEVVWKNTGSYWLPERITGKPQNWFCFNADDNALLMRTKQNWMGDAVPDRKFVVVQHEADYANPYGFATASRCFWPIVFKKGGWRFWVTFAEKYGMPWPIGKLPRGLPEKEFSDLADRLESMVQDGIAVIPNDSSVELLTTEKTSNGEIFSKLIEGAKTEVSISILGQNLTTEVTGGSFAASETHMSVRGDIIDGDKKLVEKAFNQVIKWIYEYNFDGSGDRPVFSMFEEEEVDSDLATRDGVLAEKVGVKFSIPYLNSAYGFKEGDIESVNAPTQPGTPAIAKGPARLQIAQFSEAPARSTSALFPDQAAIDAAVATLPPELLQEQMTKVLKPVIDLVQSGSSYEEIMTDLCEAYPDMDTTALEKMLSRAIFVSEVWGRLNGQK